MNKYLPYIIGVLLAVVIIEAVVLFNITPHNNDKELNDISRHEKALEALNVTIRGKDLKIEALQYERDSLEQVKTKTHETFIKEIRNVEFLPFPVKSDIFTTEAARVDSIRGRYLGRN